MTENEIFEVLKKIRAQGYAVTCFTPEELGNADPDKVQDRLCELGSDVIEVLDVCPYHERDCA